MISLWFYDIWIYAFVYTKFVLIFCSGIILIYFWIIGYIGYLEYTVSAEFHILINVDFIDGQFWGKSKPGCCQKEDNISSTKTPKRESDCQYGNI